MIMCYSSNTNYIQGPGEPGQEWRALDPHPPEAGGQSQTPDGGLHLSAVMRSGTRRHKDAEGTHLGRKRRTRQGCFVSKAL